MRTFESDMWDDLFFFCVNEVQKFMYAEFEHGLR